MKTGFTTENCLYTRAFGDVILSFSIMQRKGNLSLLFMEMLRDRCNGPLTSEHFLHPNNPGKSNDYCRIDVTKGSILNIS